jgi:imidazole glycerol-phosphate synthase subunit HisH
MFDKNNKPEIGIVECGIGNIGSVCNAFRFYGYHAKICNTKTDIRNSERIVIAGVGSFKSAVTRLKRQGLWHQLKKDILIEKKPALGICLGMQLFSSFGHEDGGEEGLNFIKGDTVKMEWAKTLPHMGWNKIIIRKDRRLFKKIRYPYFYFMHSYHFLPEDAGRIIAYAEYEGAKIASVIRKDNIIGVQFHPEKSQGDGLRFIRNFVESSKGAK